MMQGSGSNLSGKASTQMSAGSGSATCNNQYHQVMQQREQHQQLGQQPQSSYQENHQHHVQRHHPHRQGKENNVNRDDSYGGRSKGSNQLQHHHRRVSNKGSSRARATSTAEPFHQSKYQLERRQGGQYVDSSNTNQQNVYIDTGASESSLQVFSDAKGTAQAGHNSQPLWHQSSSAVEDAASRLTRKEKRDERRSPGKRDSTASLQSHYRGSFQEAAAARRQTHPRLTNARKESTEELEASPFITDIAQSHQENARIARQRIDQQTLSEPTLVSSCENLNRRRGAPLHLQASIRTRSDEHSDEKINRHESRFSTISHGDRRQSIEEAENRVSQQMSSSTKNLKNGSNQAFKSQQFQMNRNQHQSAPRSGGGQSGNKTTHALAAHFYSKHYGQGQHQQVTSNNRGERSSGRQSNQPEEHTAGNVANYLIAQPSQTMMYGRRDSKNTNNTQSASTSGHYYGSTQKTGGTSSQLRESNHMRSNNLLAKESTNSSSAAKDSYIGGLGVSHHGGFASHHNQNQHQPQNKQQIIQNLNQRYLGGQILAASQQQQHVFENTNASTQESIKQLRQQQQPQTSVQSSSKPRGQQPASKSSQRVSAGVGPQQPHHQVPPTAQHSGYASTGHRQETTGGVAPSRVAKQITAASYFSQSLNNSQAALGQKRDSTPSSGMLKQQHYDIRPRTSIEIGSSSGGLHHQLSMQPKQQASHPQQIGGLNQSMAVSSIGVNSTNFVNREGNHSAFLTGTIDTQATISMISQNPSHNHHLHQNNNQTRVSFLDDQVPPQETRNNLASDDSAGGSQHQQQRQSMLLNIAANGGLQNHQHQNHQIKGRNLNSNNQMSGHLMTDGSIDYKSHNQDTGNTVQSALAKSYQNVLNTRSSLNGANAIGCGSIIQAQAASSQTISSSKMQQKHQSATSPNNNTGVQRPNKIESSNQVAQTTASQPQQKANAAIIEHVKQRNKNYSHQVASKVDENDNSAVVKQSLAAVEDEERSIEEPQVLGSDDQILSSIAGNGTALLNNNNTNSSGPAPVATTANNNEDSTILDLKQIEDMMRASHKNSNMFMIRQNTTEPSQERQTSTAGRHQSGYTAGSRKDEESFGAGTSLTPAGQEDLKRHYHATISSQEDRRHEQRGSRQRSSGDSRRADSSSQQRQATLSVASRGDGAEQGINNSSIVLNEVDISINSPINNQQHQVSSYQASTSTSKQQNHQKPSKQQPQLQQAPQTIIIHQTQSPEAIQKAKHRLEQVCQLLAENKTCSSNLASEQEKQHAAITSVLEQLVLCQQNQYDSQCMRLLMDYQFRAAGQMQTRRLQDELQSVKKRFQAQQMLSVENKELKDKLQRQKIQLQEQERGVKKLERELEQIKVQFEVDKRETRIVRAETSKSNSDVANATTKQSHHAAAAVSGQQSSAQIQQFKRHQSQQRSASHEAATTVGRASVKSRSSTLTKVPLLDLTKVKAYEDHLREKQQVIKQQQAAKLSKQQLQQHQNQAKVSSNANVKQHKTNKETGSQDAFGSEVPSKHQMQTIQHHHSTKMNNFVGAEVNLVKLNASTIQQNDLDDMLLVKDSKKAAPQPRGSGSSHQFQDPLLQITQNSTKHEKQQKYQSSIGSTATLGQAQQSQYHRNTSQSLSPRTGCVASGKSGKAAGSRSSQQYMRQSLQQQMAADRPQTAAGYSRDNQLGASSASVAAGLRHGGNNAVAASNQKHHEMTATGSFDNRSKVRQSHNYSSAAIEGSRMVSQSMIMLEPEISATSQHNNKNNNNTQNGNINDSAQLMAMALVNREHQRMIQSRKRSMPAVTSSSSTAQQHQTSQQNNRQHSTSANSSQVHIPLLDFSKLHQPQQTHLLYNQSQQSQQKQASHHLSSTKPGSQQAQKKAMQPKQSQQSSQHSHKQQQSTQQQHQQHFQTIDVQSTSKFAAAAVGLGATVAASDDYNDSSIMRHAKKSVGGGSYEQLTNAMGTVQLRQQQHQLQHQSLQHHGSTSAKDSGIGISQSMKLMQQDISGAHQNNPQQQLSASLAVHSQASSSQPSLKFTESAGGR